MAGRDPARPPVPWLPLLQIGIGSTLIVLFGVMLGRTQAQSRALEQLDQRLQGLENARALERTSALEGQLRKMLSRLETLESSNQRLAEMAATQESLLQQLQQLRRGPGLPPEVLGTPPPRPLPPRSSERPQPPSLPQTPAMWRPPSQDPDF